MESTNKENLDPVGSPADEDVKNYSVDSLEEEATKTVQTDIVESLLPSNDQQKPFAPDGDIASNRSDITREVEEYSEDLARELLNSVKQGDKEPEEEEEKVEEAEAIKTVKEESEKLEVGNQEEESTNFKEEDVLVQPEEEEELTEPKKLVRVDSNIVELEKKNSEPIIDPLEDSYINNNPNDSPTIAKTNPDAHQTFQTAAGNSFLDFNVTDEPEPKMEFTKNYSDDLLMGQADAIQGELVSGGADLADFELPPYSGSSSGSEPKQQSPTKQRKSSTSSSAAQESNNQSASVAPPDLTAVKDLLISSYSQVSHVFHWKRPIETGVFFAIGLTLIAALTFFSIISVVAYSALGVISASGLIRLYKAVMQALSRSQETPFDHIWDKVLSLNVSMSPAKMHRLIDVSLSSFNSSLVYFKQVLLVEDKFATLKFALTLYLLTYIGAWFNGMTLITLSYLALFSVPIFYEKNKAKIDDILKLASNQATSTVSMLTSKVTSLVFSSSATSSGSGNKKQN